MILSILLGAIPGSDIRGYDIVCLPLIFKPPIQVFGVVGILVRFLDKAGLVSIILVISVEARSIFVVLVPTTTTVATFGGRFEGLYFLADQASNRGHIFLRKSCLFVRGPTIL